MSEKPKKAEKKATTLRIDLDVWKDLAHLSVEEGVAVTSLIEQAAQAFVADVRAGKRKVQRFARA